MTTPGMSAPTVRSVSNRARVNVPNLAGAVWWPLFDKQVLAATAVGQQTFFAVPIGQGGKTATDTNMELAGQIPAGQRFIITGIGVHIFPGVLPGVGSAAAGVAAVNGFANDVYSVLRTGRLKLTIGAKDYVNHGPLMRFPPANRLDTDAANATTVAATTMNFAYAAACGSAFATFDTELMANQNFSVTLFDLPALPSTVAGTVVVDLYGWLYRNAQ